MTEFSLSPRIRKILKEHARLGDDPLSLADTADLYPLGMTSHTSVNVILAPGCEFEVEVSDQMLTRNVFSSVWPISSVLEELKAV